jgi:hypothetical protein
MFLLQKNAKLLFFANTGLVHQKLNLIFEQSIVSILLTNFVFYGAGKMPAILYCKTYKDLKTL